MPKTWRWSTTGYSFADRPADETLEICRQAGLAGLEVAPPLYAAQSDGEQQRIAARFRDAGVALDSYHLPFAAADDIASFYETVRRRAVDTMLWHLERAASLGCRVAIQHPTTSRFDVGLEGLDQYVRQIGHSLETLLPRAASLGMAIAVENMLPSEITVPGTSGERFGSRPEHLCRLAAEFAHPSFGFCLDTGHALIAGGPGGEHAFFEAMGPHLLAFHLADNAGDRDSHLAPGHGLVDWRALFCAVDKLGFPHCLCIEAAPFAYGPHLTQSVEAWVQMVADTEALAVQALQERV